MSRTLPLAIIKKNHWYLIHIFLGIVPLKVLKKNQMRIVFVHLVFGKLKCFILSPSIFFDDLGWRENYFLYFHFYSSFILRNRACFEKNHVLSHARELITRSWSTFTGRLYQRLWNHKEVTSILVRQWTAPNPMPSVEWERLNSLKWPIDGSETMGVLKFLSLKPLFIVEANQSYQRVL